jgi:DNA-binding PadR family transcriptional regulator
MAATTPPTAYALLGLLTLKSWTTYELARQSERSLRWFFPRAERGVYQEAKRLVDLGWAASKESWVGRRRGTTYRITAAGRRALREWVGERPTPLQLESEGLLRLFLADPTRLGDFRSGVGAMGDDAALALGQLAAMAAQWETGEAQFRERGPTNAVVMRLVADVHRTVAAWAEWADDAVDQIESGPEPARRLADEVFGEIARSGP